MYLVFVCPKCERNAQLLEPGHKTVRCQRCSSIIQTKSLRVLGSFEEREEAVFLRSQLQAELANQPDGIPVQRKEDGTVYHANDHVFETKTPLKTKSKKADEIICEILREKGPLIVADCEYYCQEKGLEPEKFQEMLQKLIQKGDVYRPDKGIVALVP
ncbi:DUF5817 domain-containing protein [Methanolapillus millepedarum]|uniref:DUF5817 domain-containing protein n=1 Tax=Methanolapillus millepedarum TaxID=3028296 RepID=A0AA96ZUN8_9EURY|nr:hypothetical protein MsAc7_13980 [Methanosarcinaceae archaeon Ac7]